MNVEYLDIEARERLRSRLLANRDELQRVLKRMQSLGWYTADPVLCSVMAAERSLTAALCTFPDPKAPAKTSEGPLAWNGYPQPIHKPAGNRAAG